MVTGNKFPKYLLIIPSIWAIIGASAAIQFGVYQDAILLITAIISDTILFKYKK
jgi:inorganic pyrophosphatase/exopolyphosphatase